MSELRLRWLMVDNGWFHFLLRLSLSGEFRVQTEIEDQPGSQVIFAARLLCKCGLYRHAVSVSLSVCLSVSFVNSVKRNKLIFNFFHRRVAKPF